MAAPANKTKIVCTIGPPPKSQGVMEKMLLAGMNIVQGDPGIVTAIEPHRPGLRACESVKDLGRTVRGTRPKPRFRPSRLCVRPSPRAPKRCPLLHGSAFVPTLFEARNG
jgi:hypothetical protein